jgi:integrase
MAVRKDSRGIWRYRKTVRLLDGKTERISGTPSRNTRDAAEQAERAHIDRVLNPPAPTIEKKEAPKFATFADDYLIVARTDEKPSSIASKEMIFRVHLKPRFGHLRLDEIGYGEIQDYAAAKAKKLAKKTVNNHLTVLRRILVVAKKRGLIASVPEIEWLSAPKPEFDFLSFEEADRLARTAEDDWQRMIVLALRTGLRQGELLALRWEDVDLKAGVLHVRRSVTQGKVTDAATGELVSRKAVTEPKSGKGREVPLGDGALAVLRAQRHLRSELVFCGDDGRMLGKNECKWPLWSSCKRAGLRRIGWHVLRHTFASHLVMRGVPLRAVQDLMGHATVEMTMRYAHLSPNVPREAVRLLDVRSDNGLTTDHDSRPGVSLGT